MPTTTRKAPPLTKPPLDHIPVTDPPPRHTQLKRAAIAAVAAGGGIGLLLVYPVPVLAIGVLAGVWTVTCWFLNETEMDDD